MAEDEMAFIRVAEKFIDGQIEQVKALLVYGLKVYPKSIALKDLLQQYQDIKIFNTPDSTQQENEEVKQNKLQNERELDQIKCKIKKDIKEIKQQEKVNENGSFQMRIKTLITELNALIEHENDTWKKIHLIETCIGIVYTALDLKNFEKAENELLKAESLSTVLMKKIKITKDSEMNQNLHSIIANNSLKMRLKVLNMEKNILKTYSVKQLFEDEKDTWSKIQNIETCLGVASTVLKINNFEKAENQLLTAETLSTELMKVLKKATNKNFVIKDLQIPQADIHIPDYGFKTTVKGTKEDVINCILKAKTALDADNNDKGECFLLQAVRIYPNKKARDLQTAGEPKDNANPIEIATKAEQNIILTKEESKSENGIKSSKAFEEAFISGNFVKAERMLIKAKRFDPDHMGIATEAVEQVDTIKEEESKPGDGTISAVKCLIIFEKAFSAGNFYKAEQMLNKAKSFDPELDIELKLSQVKAAVIKKTMKEQRKDQMEKLENDRKMAGECFYKAMKACYAGNFTNAEQFLLLTKLYAPMMNLEQEMLSIRTKMASESSKENKNLSKTVPEEFVTGSNMVLAAEYLYNAKKAYDAGDFKAAQRNLLGAEKCDPSLDLKPYFSKCSAEIASRSSTKGDAVIPEKISNTMRTYNQNDYELCKHYVKEAETAYRNRNAIETTKLLKMAESCHPCMTVNEMLERVDNLNPAKPSHKITTSETKFSCLEDEKQREKKDYPHEVNQFCKDKKGSLKNEKTKQNTRVKKHTISDRCNFAKDNKKQTPNRVKLQQMNALVKQVRHCIGNGEFEKAKVVLLKAQDIHATSTVKAFMEEVEKGLENVKRSKYSSKCNIDFKTLKPPKEKQVKTLISMAEKAMNDKNFEDAINLLNEAEEIYPTNEAKALIKSVNEIQISHGGDTLHLNCYELPSEANESDKAEALKCLKLAQAAFQEGRNEKAERLLLKSLRIWDSQKAKSFLENVRNAIAQNNTNLKTEKQYYSLSERNNDYSKYIELAEKAIAGGKLDKAELLLLKAIRINANDGAKEQLENIRRFRLSQSCEL